MNAAIKELGEALGREMCHRCGCCEMLYQMCETCGGEGVDGHDCGEDACCCLHPEENMVCDVCGGDGGWWECTCDEKGKHTS